MALDGIPIEDLVFPPNNEGIPPETPQPQLDQLSVDGLWQLIEEAKAQIADLSRAKTRYEAELMRRFEAAHPDYGPGTGGTVELAGDFIVVKLSYSRNYAWQTETLAKLRGQQLITEAEYQQLIPSWEPKVDGRYAGQLMKRGGEVKAMLETAKFLKSSSPSFDVKDRV